MSPNEKHQELLHKYAEAIVKVGLNLRKGQRLIITNATARGVPPAGRALVHEVTKASYAAGAKYVEVIWGDEEIHRIRLQNAPADSFDEYPKFHVNAVLDMIKNGDALLSIYANDPDAFSGLDAERVGAMQKSHLQNYAPIGVEVSRNAINWCVVASVTLPAPRRYSPISNLMKPRRNYGRRSLTLRGSPFPHIRLPIAWPQRGEGRGVPRGREGRLWGPGNSGNSPQVPHSTA